MVALKEGKFYSFCISQKFIEFVSRENVIAVKREIEEDYRNAGSEVAEIFVQDIQVYKFNK